MSQLSLLEAPTPNWLLGLDAAHPMVSAQGSFVPVEEALGDPFATEG